MYYILSVLVGILIIVATILNGKVADKIGMVSGMKLNYAMGAIFSVILMVILKDSINVVKAMKLAFPIYFFSGVLGVASLYMLNTAVVNISAFYIVILPFIGQIAMGLLIDYFALNIFSLGKLIGGLTIVFGLIVYNKKEQVKIN